jgi:hypothetical protein
LLYLLAQNPARIIIITGIAPKTDDLERENLAFQKSNLYQHHRKKQKRMGYTTEEQSLKSLVATFLADLAHANHSPQTYRFCATDLTQLCALHHGPILAITADVLRMFFERHVHLRPATRARKQAAVAGFLSQQADAEVRTWRRRHSQHLSAREG